MFDHLLSSVAEEMGAALARSAFSPNIKERRDFSCALFDAHGRMISQAAHIPIHLGSIPLCVQAAIRDVSMEPGDAVILNDPYRGGTHLPDVTLVTPIFLTGRRSADFYCANRAHHADVGGAHPGSMAPAFDLHGEGLCIPPTKLVRRGKLDRELLALLVANMRVPSEREGDLHAQTSANSIGSQRMLELAREHGVRELVARSAALRAWTARLTRELIANLPRRAAEFEDVLEDGDRDVAVRLRVERAGSRLVFDFCATDDQVESPINTPRAVAVSAVFYVLRLLLPEYTPTNDGVLEPLLIRTRSGSLVDARYPAPVAAGNVETSQRLVDTLLGAFAKLVPDRIPAASAGTMSNLSFGGARSSGGAFTYYETVAGGAGASANGSGASGVHTHMTNTRNTPIEAFERAIPSRVVAYGLRKGSGGGGRHSGGDGIEKRLLFLAPVRVGWVADRSRRGPWGLGGRDGAPGSGEVRLANSRSARRLSSKTSIELPSGSQFRLRTPGGGGWSPRS